MPAHKVAQKVLGKSSLPMMEIKPAIQGPSHKVALKAQGKSSSCCGLLWDVVGKQSLSSSDTLIHFNRRNMGDTASAKFNFVRQKV
jgi:hypothetical protein